MQILVVDDEPAVRDSLDRALRLEGYKVDLAADGAEALKMLGEDSADAVVLDLMMPRVDGLEVCRRMRAAGDRTPVLVLTARDAVSDRVKGLDAGADDYLVKPFALDELLARLRALLRRSGTAAPGQVLRFSDLTLDPVAHQVRRGDREIELTRTEFLLLELFMLHPRQVLTRSVIFERVWGYDFGPDSNSLEVYVSYLRRKLEAADEPRLLHTVRGVGYVLARAMSGLRSRLRLMSFRDRLVLLATAAVAVAVVVSSAVVVCGRPGAAPRSRRRPAAQSRRRRAPARGLESLHGGERAAASPHAAGRRRGYAANRPAGRHRDQATGRPRRSAGRPAHTRGRGRQEKNPSSVTPRSVASTRACTRGG